MNQELKSIYLSFKGKLIGSKRMKNEVCEVLSQMSANIIEFVTENCWFMSSMDDAYAFTFTGNDLKNQHLIFLSDDLFNQNIAQIHYTIAHEIGHVILGHRNSTLSNQSKQEIKKQEKEADEFAIRYV